MALVDVKAKYGKLEAEDEQNNLNEEKLKNLMKDIDNLKELEAEILELK
jgi:hypothetical protein